MYSAAQQLSHMIQNKEPILSFEGYEEAPVVYAKFAAWIIGVIQHRHAKMSDLVWIYQWIIDVSSNIYGFVNNEYIGCAIFGRHDRHIPSNGHVLNGVWIVMKAVHATVLASYTNGPRHPYKQNIK